jgi:hypothetical protein
MSRSGIRFPEAAPPLAWEAVQVRAGLDRVESNVVRVALQCAPWPPPPHGATGGSVQGLPSGALRVSVCSETDPLTGRRHYLREHIPAGPIAHAEAQKAMRRLANQVDERRNPRTNATVDQLLDRHFKLASLKRTRWPTIAAWPTNTSDR